MDITPSLVTPELAVAALASLALSRAFGLATWIGDGKELTASGTLRPPDAAEACQVLGIDLPSEPLRSMDDVPELGHVWETALHAGFIMVDGTYVRASGLDEVTADPEVAIRSWLRALAPKFDLPEEPCGRCLTVLAELAEAADGVASSRDLLHAVGMAFPGPDGPDDLARELRHALLTISNVLAFAAAIPVNESEYDDRVRLTPLGRMLAGTVFAMLAIDPAADVDTAVARLAEVPSAVGMFIARPWLAARNPTATVRELLGFAESATTQQRTVAVTFAKKIAPDEVEPWREYAGVPGFGAYAREWLRQLGEKVTADPRDEAWLTVETISLAEASLPPDAVSEMISSAAGRYGLSDLPTMLTMLRESGHPDAERVAAAIGEVVSPVPLRSTRAPGGRVYQLKVTLRDVSEPSVWRRVLVPASTRLGALASVIQVAMGWDGWHQHMFSDGSREYPETASARNLLSKPGDRLDFTYDFGDGWEHDLELEDIVQNDAGVTLPACLDGAGACPPEDSGGPSGYAQLKEILADPGHDRYDERLDWLGLESGDDFDPAAFSVEKVNAQLSRLRPSSEAAHSAGLAKVVRIQPRAKKKKVKRKR